MVKKHRTSQWTDLFVYIFGKIQSTVSKYDFLERPCLFWMREDTFTKIIYIGTSPYLLQIASWKMSQLALTVSELYDIINEEAYMIQTNSLGFFRGQVERQLHEKHPDKRKKLSKLERSFWHAQIEMNYS